jgi:transcriptional regulator with XRE-family HTH domain
MEKDIKLTLRAARTNLGLTRKEAAKLLEIHHETLANYEHDSTNIPRLVFMRVEKAFGIPVDNIFFGKEAEFYRLQRKAIKENVAAFREVMP